MHLPISILHWEFRVQNKLAFKNFIGYYIRSAIFENMKALFCTKKEIEKCIECLLIFECPVPLFFETPGVKKFKDHPRPLIIKPPVGIKDIYNENEIFSFSTCIIGEKIINNIDYLFEGIRRLEESGIGEKEGEQRSKVKFENLYFLNPFTQEKRNIYQFGYLYKSNIFLDEREIIKETERVKKKNILKIDFLTPTRIIADRKILKTEIPFSSFFKRLSERIYALSDFLPKPLDFKYVNKKSEEIKLLESSLNWVNLQKYSTRRKRIIPGGGILGFCVYEGDFKEFSYALVLGEIVHIGKWTISGYGWFKIE